MSQKPTDTNRPPSNPSPVQVRFFTNEHGWVEVDPNRTPSQQPAASTWFQPPSQTTDLGQGGYHTMVVESACFQNNGHPQQSTMMFSSVVPPTSTSDSSFPQPPPMYQPGMPFPNIPPPPCFGGFPPQMINPWAPGGINGPSPTTPFPLYTPNQAQTATPQMPFIPQMFPGSPQMPFPNLPRMNPWFPPDHMQHTISSPQQPPINGNLDPNKTTNNSSSAGIHRNNNSSCQETRWSKKEWVDSLHTKLACHHCCCHYSVPTHWRRRCERPRDELRSGDDCFRVNEDDSEPNSHSMCSFNNDTKHHLGKRRFYPKIVSTSRQVDTWTHPPPPMRATPRHVDDRNVTIDCRYGRSGSQYTHCGSNYPYQSEKFHASYFIPTQIESVDDGRPDSAGSLATAYPQPGLNRLMNREEPGYIIPLSNSPEMNACLPPPPCQCCHCFQVDTRPFSNHIDCLFSVPRTSGQVIRQPLKHFASHERVDNRLAYFGSTDMNAGHSLEALESPINAVYAPNSVSPQSAYAEESPSTDSIITAFVNAASRRLEVELNRVRTNKYPQT